MLILLLFLIIVLFLFRNRIFGIESNPDFENFPWEEFDDLHES